MDAFRIARAAEADVPVILSLIRGLAEYEHARPGDLSVDENLLRASLFGPKPAAETLIAWEADRAVGFALFFHNFSTWRGRHGLYLEDLFVIPQARGKGYGKALLRELARIARERGCARMEWAVLDWNTPAIEFYKSLGAVPLHEWTIFRVEGEGIERLSHSAHLNPGTGH